MKNVSMCRYRYILKVSDTDTVSNTKGLQKSEEVPYQLASSLKNFMFIRVVHDAQKYQTTVF